MDNECAKFATRDEWFKSLRKTTPALEAARLTSPCRALLAEKFINKEEPTQDERVAAVKESWLEWCERHHGRQPKGRWEDEGFELAVEVRMWLDIK